MDFKIDRFSILYGLGVILGIVAVIYFGQQLILDLSPTIKSLLLLFLFLFFLIVGIYTDTSILDNVSLILSGSSYIIFLGYTIFRFNIGQNGTFLFLAFSSVLFIGLGYLLREKNTKISSKQVKILIIGLVLVSGILLVADISGSQPTYSLDLKEQIYISNNDTSIDRPIDRRSIEVGSITIRNDFVLSRIVDVPSYDACIYLPQLRRVSTFTENPRNNIIGGGETKRHRLNIRFPIPRQTTNNTQINYTGTYTIERHNGTDCPKQTQQKKITIVNTPNNN